MPTPSVQTLQRQYQSSQVKKVTSRSVISSDQSCKYCPERAYVLGGVMPPMCRDHMEVAIAVGRIRAAHVQVTIERIAQYTWFEISRISQLWNQMISEEEVAE
jgi:hypothetical protein